MERELQSVQVVGLGQACVDYVGRVPVYPVEDSKMELEGFFTSCGGPAATALVTLARLEVLTSFLGSRKGVKSPISSSFFKQVLFRNKVMGIKKTISKS